MDTYYEESAETSLEALQALGRIQRPRKDIKVFVIDAGESVSESIVKHLRERAAEMGISVAVVDKLPENISVGLGEEVLKLIRNETAPTASELAESMQELTIECTRPYIEYADQPSQTPPPKGHHSRTFGGVGRKHFQR